MNTQGTGPGTGTGVILSPNAANANATVNGNVNLNASVNLSVPSSGTSPSGISNKVESSTSGSASGSDAGGQVDSQDGKERKRERESKEAVRDLTAVFASCDSNAVQSTVTTSKGVSSSSRVAEVIVKTRPHIVPILSFTPYIEQEETTSLTTSVTTSGKATDSATAIAIQRISKPVEIPLQRGPDAITSPTSIVHPPPVSTLPLPQPLPQPLSSSLPLPPSLPNPSPSPAYPSCFVGSTRRGSLTRYTQLCNKMEPLIENVLERMDSTGNLLDLDAEISKRRASIVNKLKKLNKIQDKDDIEENDKNNEKIIENSSFLNHSGSSIENIVEGGIPFSSFGKPLPISINNTENNVINVNDNNNYSVNKIKLKDEVLISQNAYISNKIDNDFLEENNHLSTNLKNKTDDGMSSCKELLFISLIFFSETFLFLSSSNKIVSSSTSSFTSFIIPSSFLFFEFVDE